MNKPTIAKPQKKYAPTRTEVAKTVLIAILVTAGIAFVIGMRFEQGRQAQVNQAMSAAAVEAPASK